MTDPHDRANYCYRHPDRESHIRCQRCSRPICPDCMTTTSVGMRCPECSRDRTKVRTMGNVTEPTLTYVLIGINVMVALGAVFSGASASGSGGWSPTTTASGSAGKRSPTRPTSSKRPRLRHAYQHLLPTGHDEGFGRDLTEYDRAFGLEEHQ